MSKVHVLTEGNGGYQVYIHTAMPSGVNAVGNSWSACYIAAFNPVTKMAIGSGIGQISSSEAASIIAGTELEFQSSIPANFDGSAPTSTQVNTFVDVIISSNFAVLQAQLKYFGYTQ